MSGSEPVQSVVRSLRLLNAIAAVGEAGVVELADEVDLRPSTAHRLLATLAGEGYVAHDASSRRYRLGGRLLALAATAEDELASLRARAARAMTALRDELGETVNLVVLDRDHIVYVDQAESSRPVRAFNRIGNRVPAHASGAGKALLAYESPPTLEALVATAPFPALTASTVTTAAGLLARLDEVRARGYALDEGEYDEDVVCVAAPILGDHGRAVAALSVSGPAERMRRRDLGGVGTDLARAAATVLLRPEPT